MIGINDGQLVANSKAFLMWGRCYDAKYEVKHFISLIYVAGNLI